jgi:multidrug efflux system membrane fusion protein
MVRMSTHRFRHAARLARGRWHGLSFLTALTLAAVTGCARTAAQPAPEGPPRVSVAEVLERPVTEWDEFTGRLEPVETVEVRPRVSGYVAAVRFKEGAIVRKGDPLFEIDDRPFVAEVDRLRAELMRARATVQRSRSELQRAERLRAENAMSLEEHDRRASFAQEAAAQVAAVEAALRAVELNLEFTRVVSPITGRVSRALVTPGNLVSSGPAQATLMTTVVSLDPIYAHFDADEGIFLRYSALARSAGKRDAASSGLPIQMALANETGFPRQGRLDFLDNRLDPASGTIRGRAAFRNPDGALTPGLFVRLRVAGSGTVRALLIQDAAVGTDLDKKYVLTVGGDSSIQYRPVSLGPIVDGLRVVRSGLAAGDRVVVNGLQRVRPGAKVDALAVAMDPAAPPPVAANAAQ